MAISVPSYNSSVSKESTGNMNSHTAVCFVQEQKPLVNTEVSSIPFLPLVNSEIELAIEINKDRIKEYLHSYYIDQIVLDKLVQKPSLVNYLYHVQSTIPFYFEKYSLQIEYFLDPEEEYETINIIVNSPLNIENALDLEDVYFDKEFASIYRSTDGILTFRVKSNAV